jgi:TRAP-type C4-dicarboxylate transport system permease small subunit
MRKVIACLSSVLEAVAAVCILVIAALIAVAVIARYVFNSPIFGSSEIVQILLVIGFFAALAPVGLADRHIKVDLLDRHLNRWLPRGREVLVSAATVAALLIIAYQVFVQAATAAKFDRTTIILEIPYAYLMVPAGVFCLIAALLQLAQLARPKRHD